MAEQHTLTTPTTATTTLYTLTYVGFDLVGQRIVVSVTSDQGALLTHTYDSTTVPTGATLLHNLNTGNFSSTSLVKITLQRLATDGVIPAGSVTGTPS
jgi:hypothetical protein